jgi:hypothetical protein
LLIACVFLISKANKGPYQGGNRTPKTSDAACISVLSSNVSRQQAHSGLADGLGATVENQAITPTIRVNECNRLWVLKKSVIGM